MQTKKVDSILAEREEETFEFAPVRQLDGDRYVSNVQNHSHDDGEAHIYPVFFDVAQDGAVFGAHVAECGCPADEYHSGPCKHREAASECGELLGRVIETALDDDQDAHESEAGAEAAVTDGGRPEDCECDEVDPCWNCVKNGRKSLDDGGLVTDGGQPQDDELTRLEDGQVFHDSDGTRWTVDKRVTRVPTPEGTFPRTRLVADTGRIQTIKPREFVLAVERGEFSKVVSE